LSIGVVSIRLGFQFNLDLKSHGHIRAPAREILWPHQFAYPIRASGDLLQNLQGKPNGCLARAVLPDQQEGRLAGDWQFEVLQATEVMNVEASHHNK
jgi:hypothetical protein